MLHRSNGEVALRVLAKQEVAAVLADLNVPRLSGLQLLDQVRPWYPGLAFLVVTGEDDVRVVLETMRNGADTYLVEPMQREVLLDGLERALEKKRLERQLAMYKQRLEGMVEERTQQLQSAIRQLERSYGRRFVHLAPPLTCVTAQRPDTLTVLHCALSKSLRSCM